MDSWTPRIEAELRETASPLFRRALVLDTAGSTQDEALARSDGPGLVLTASSQTGGRGRLGRAWQQRGDLGLAITFVLPAGAFPADRLSIAAGLAAARAIDDFAAAGAPVGVRWPNDVVEAEPRPGGGRKLAGVLVEVKSGLALLGIGINANQNPDDWPDELRRSAVSVREITGNVLDRCSLACALVRRLHAALAMPMTELIPAWLARDVLRGSFQRFVCGGREVSGIVDSLEPSGSIVVRNHEGVRAHLPALTTSMVK